MTPAEIISTLNARGVSLWEEGGTLRYRAPAGVLTEQERATLRAHKASLIKALSTPTVSASVTPVPEKLDHPKPKDRLCYEYRHFQRSPHGFPLGLCQQHGDKNEHPNGRIQHSTSRPTQFGCGDFAFRQTSDDGKICTECRHYNPLSTTCSQVNTGCPYPTIPPCHGDKFQHKLKAVKPNKEVVKQRNHN